MSQMFTGLAGYFGFTASNCMFHLYLFYLAAFLFLNQNEHLIKWIFLFCFFFFFLEFDNIADVNSNINILSWRFDIVPTNPSSTTVTQQPSSVIAGQTGSIVVQAKVS